jgi:SAM-dependent methyltransferase
VELRRSFEQRPELYDRARPGYPPTLFDDLAALTGLAAGARICEVGCGTGQATLPLAERGFRVTCVELGTQLAAIAHRKLAPYPGVEVVNADFEHWRPEQADFDAVVAFTSFHWLDPSERYERVASILRPDGMLALVTTEHVLPEDGDRFFSDVQADYEAVTPEDPKTREGGPRAPDAIGDLSAEIEASARFRPTATRRYVYDMTYTADSYIALLETYSGHRALDAERRARLFDLIRARIDSRPGGEVRKTYLAILNVAQLA